MKKIWYMLSIFLLALVLVACKDDPTVEPIPTETPIVEDTTAPLLFGVTDAVVDQGDTVFTLLAGITAIDDVDGTITSNIVVSGTFDVNTLGTYPITYTITDAAGNVTTLTRQVIVREKPSTELYVINGDFSEPISSGWTHWAGEGGASTATIVDGVLEYDITANGGQWWSSQFSQPNLKITQGKNYKLVFDAKADIPRGMVIKLENSGYVAYLEANVMLTGDWVTYEYEFFVTMDSIVNGKLIFGAGTMVGRLDDANALTTIYLDNVEFIEVDPSADETDPVITGATDKTISTGDTIDLLEGVTVSDNQDITLTPADIVITGTVDVNTPGDYVITYTLEDASGNETVVTRTITVVSGLVPSTWLVINGDFATEQLAPVAEPADTGWGWKPHASGGSFTAQIKDGIAMIDIDNLGTVPYGVQFFQQNRVIVQGHIYRITFDAKADIARPIQIALEEGTTRRFDTIVDLTTDWVTYTIEFQHILPGYSNGKFAFFMGMVGTTSVPTTIYLDNVKVETIEEIVDNAAPVLRGLDNMVIVKGFAFDPLKNITIFDAVDKDLTVEDIVITGDVDETTVGTYTLTYTITDATDHTATYTRTIEVKEAIDMLDSTFVLINGDMQVDQATPIAQPATTGWGWHGAGTFTVNIADGIMTQVISSVGTVPYGTQFYQQNRVIETQAIYRVSYDAKVDIARSIKLSLEAGTNVNWSEIVDITTSWASYESFIYVPASGFTNGKFAFFAGLVEADSPATTFYLDNVEIELVGYVVDDKAPMMFGVTETQTPVGIPFEPLLGISVYDLIDKSLTTADIVITGTVNVDVPGDYLLTYTLTDRQGNVTEIERNVIVTESGGGLPSTFELINGDFAIDQAAPATAGTGWGWHGSGSWKIELIDGAAKIQVFDTWALFYGVQFYTLNRVVTEGHTYLISFRAKADAPRPLQLNLESGGAKFSAYFELGTDYETFTYEYTHTSASITNGKFSFFVGDIFGQSHPTTVYIDDVEVTRIIEKSVDVTAPQIWNVNDTFVKEDTFFDPKAGLKVYDHVDTTLTVDDVVVTGTVDVTTPADYTLTYTLEDANGNEKTYTRVVTVLEAAVFDYQRVELLDPSFTEELPITNLDNNVGWTLKTSGTGAFNPHTFVDGAIAIQVTNVGTVPHGIQFFQRNTYRVELGQTYLLTFKAKADLARDIRVSFENTTGNFQVMQFNVVPITTEWATYEVVFTNMANSTPDFKVGLFLGLIETDKPERSAATTVYFDDVTFELVSLFKDNVDPMIYTETAEVVEDAVFNPLTGIKVGDFAKAPTVVVTSDTVGLVTYDALTGVYTVDTSTIGTYTLTYTVTDIYGNETIHTRTLNVIAAPVE
jgi:hypothetical protein